MEKIDIKEYKKVMWWSPEDESFIVQVPELPGCMADGKTEDEAIRNTYEVIQIWIDTAREDGAEVPLPAAARDLQCV